VVAADVHAPVAEDDPVVATDVHASGASTRFGV